MSEQKQYTHPFSVAQREHVVGFVQRIQDLEKQKKELTEQLNQFLSFLVKEHSLPAVVGGYDLNDNATGLIGTLPSVTDK